SLSSRHSPDPGGSAACYPSPRTRRRAHEPIPQCYMHPRIPRARPVACQPGYEALITSTSSRRTITAPAVDRPVPNRQTLMGEPYPTAIALSAQRVSDILVTEWGNGAVPSMQPAASRYQAETVLH